MFNCDNMDQYINGGNCEQQTQRKQQQQLLRVTYRYGDIEIACYYQDANFYKLLCYQRDGLIYHMKSSTMLGKTQQMYWLI
jgi:hypothetical protein